MGIYSKKMKTLKIYILSCSIYHYLIQSKVGYNQVATDRRLDEDVVYNIT